MSGRRDRRAVVHQRWLVVLLVASTAVVGPAAIAHASCAGEPRDLIEQAAAAAVVTVVRNDGDQAVVEVEEVWRGPDLAPIARLGTSPAAGKWWPPRFLAAATSVDADLRPGRRYIVATEDGHFRTNACLSLEATPDTVAQLAPSRTRAPVHGAEDGTARTTGMVVPIVIVATVGMGVLVALRRRAS